MVCGILPFSDKLFFQAANGEKPRQWYHRTIVKMYICPVMNQPAQFFAEFPPVSKEEWLARIVKDLKGKPLEDLYWQLNDEIRVDPFGHADDWPQPPQPLYRESGSWEINEDVDVQDAATANRQALEALQSGATALRFRLPAGPATNDLPDRLRGIYLDHIGLHFCGDGAETAPAAVMAALKTAARDMPSRALRGSLHYDPAADPGRLQDWRYLSELLQYTQAEFPGFRCITVNGHSEFGGPAGAAAELAALLRRSQIYFENLSEKSGVPADKLAAQIQFSLYVGKSYFVEIAKLRAFNILWLNFLKAWDARGEYPVLDARFAPADYTDDLYGNMIRATTMAMSAALGGANRITVLPYDAGREEKSQYPQSFARRIARNVQHLLQLESGFTELSDPSAGSYYIEKLTAQLAETAWGMFQKG